MQGEMYKIVLIIIGVLVLYGIFAFQNPFNNAKVTAIRGVVAILVGWAMVILISLLANNMEAATVTTASEILALEEQNKARMMGALSFGWAYPLIFVELIWGAVYLTRFYKDKNNLNTKLLKSLWF